MWYVGIANSKVILTDEADKIPLRTQWLEEYPPAMKAKDVLKAYLDEYISNRKLQIIVDTKQVYLVTNVGKFQDSLRGKGEPEPREEEEPYIDGLEERFNEIQNGLY